MALARVKTWNAGDTLTAADLNAEYNNILNNPTSLINLSAAGDVCIVSSAAAVTRLAIGTAPQALTVSTGLLPAWSAPILQSYLSGCQITAMTVSSSGTITHSSGVAVDGTNVTAMVLSSALVGTTTGAFIAGNNQPKLQVSPLTASTSYLIYVISSAIGGSVDVLYSSSTSPTLPTGYTKSRRVGGFITTSTGGLLQMVQDGDYFTLTTAYPTDINVANPSTAGTLAALTVPSGFNVQALVNLQAQNDTVNNLTVSVLDPAGATAFIGGNGFGSIRSFGSAATINVAGPFQIRTNTAQQVRYTANVLTTNGTFALQTLGWFDRRGRDA